MLPILICQYSFIFIICYNYYMQNSVQDILKNNLSKNIINSPLSKTNIIPIIAIDGPSASGKGTISRKLAEYFNFNYLNSGSLYRLTAYIAKNKNIDFKNEDEIVKIGANLSPIFLGEKVLIDGIDIWPEISKEGSGKLAAEISPIIELRETLFTFQRSQIKNPGLVAEGRDMTSEVFTDAKIKIYLDATPEVQARRRLKDEQDKNINTTYEELLESMRKRDYVDKNRKMGALRIVPDALYIDTSNLNREEVFEIAKNYCEKILNKK